MIQVIDDSWKMHSMTVLNFLKTYKLKVLTVCAVLIIFVVYQTGLLNYDQYYSINNQEQMAYPTIQTNDSSKVVRTQRDFDAFVDTNCPVDKLKVTYECLPQLANYSRYNQVEETRNDEIYYHSYLDFEYQNEYMLQQTVLFISSYLATQNLERTKLLIWVLDKFDGGLETYFFDKYRKYFNRGIIQIKRFVFQDLCSNGVFMNYFDTCSKFGGSLEHDKGGASDFVRFLVLYKYGGIYLDGDTIFLRDLKPFWFKNFVYRWSFLKRCNTAVIGLDLANMDFMNRLYDPLLAQSSTGGYITYHPANVYSVLENTFQVDPFENDGIKIYHSALFDPAWLCQDKMLQRVDANTVCLFTDLFQIKISEKNFKFENFFPGAYTYHIHNSDNIVTIDTDSYFYHLTNYFQSLLQ